MKEIKCIKCGETREAEFYSHCIKIGDCRCKQCCREYSKKWKETNAEKVREYGRNYMREHPEQNNASSKRWYENNAKLHYEWRLQYAQVDPQRHRAQCYALQAYPDAQTCSMDGCFELGERHHDDYNTPLEIRWVCKKHHKLLHKKVKMALVL